MPDHKARLDVRRVRGRLQALEATGQLEEELSRNGWLTVQADPEIIFSVPPEERFAAAVRLLGIDVAMLSGEAGHA